MVVRLVSESRLALLLAPLVLAAGCPIQTPTDPSFPFLDQDGNFSFANATALSLSSAGDALQFSGSIDSAQDADIYSLGALATGDHLFVDVQRASGDLDAVAAVFDARQFLELYSDDRSPSGDDLNPLIDDAIRGPPGEYFLGIAAFPESSTRGSYRVTVRVTRGGTAPGPVGQTVFLDWNGGDNLVVANVGTFNLPPFAASQVGLDDSQTGRLKDLVQQGVAQRYAGLNLVVLNSDDHAEPAAPHSTIYFGSTSRQAFAISQQVDSFNHDAQDNAIVFTGAFAGAFPGTPSLDEIATAIVNTTAHEIGHLLGLVHTADSDELMDTTGTNARLLQPQSFGTAVLDQSVFPTGFQNAVELLAWTIGTIGI